MVMSRPSKRRKTNSAVEEIAFDPSARYEYLTGFHKRKQQRIQHAKEETARKEREFKIQQRKELREQRERDIQAHVESVNAILKKQRESSSESDNDDNEEDDLQAEHVEVKETQLEENIGHEAEYIDEDKFTTVTVEPMNISDGEESEEIAQGSEADGEQTKPSIATQDRSTKKLWTKDNPNKNRQKTKRKKFRYESKGERKAERRKQKIKKSAAARTRRGAD